MLDAFIIDQLRRERERKQWEPIPLHLPLRSPPPEDSETVPANEDEEGDDRGVVIIDKFGKTERL